MNTVKTKIQTGVCPICGKTGLKFGSGAAKNTDRTICSNENYVHYVRGHNEYIVRVELQEA